MASIYAGLVLLIASNATALVLVGSASVSLTPEVLKLCDLLGETAAECTAGALHAGWVMLAGGLIALILASTLPGPAHPSCRTLRDGWLPRLVVVGVTVTLAMHAAVLHGIGVAVSRTEVLSRTASLISLENLAWPLLLQIAALQTGWRERLLYLAPALVIAGFSPWIYIALTIPAWIAPMISTTVSPRFRSSDDPQNCSYSPKISGFSTLR